MSKFLFALILMPCLVFCNDKPYIIYGGHGCGMFSAFLMVVGLLDGYDKGEYAGVEVRFGKGEFYYDEAHGPNRWEYYFSPINTKKDPLISPEPLTSNLFFFIAHQGHSALSRKRCHDLIEKYITIKPEFLNQVDDFLKTNVHDETLIGIHYRATDKFCCDAPSISPEKVCAKIKEEILKLSTGKIKIFVATDSESFLQFMKTCFGTKVIYFDMKRSQGDAPIHTDYTIDGYTKGKMALLDCLVLSKCDLLLRTASNLSNASTLLNPTVPVIRLNYGYRRDWDRE